MGAEGLFLIVISELSPYYKLVKHKTEEAKGPVLPLAADEGPILQLAAEGPVLPVTAEGPILPFQGPLEDFIKAGTDVGCVHLSPDSSLSLNDS